MNVIPSVVCTENGIVSSVELMVNMIFLSYILSIKPWVVYKEKNIEYDIEWMVYIYIKILSYILSMIQWMVYTEYR